MLFKTSHPPLKPAPNPLPPTTRTPAPTQVEFAAQLLCFGLSWCKKPAHLLDVTVVVASLVLEIVLRRSDLKDVVALLIVFRLWRIVRVLHATEEIMHIEAEKKLELQQEEVRALKGALREARRALADREAQLEDARAGLAVLKAKVASAEGEGEEEEEGAAAGGDLVAALGRF